LGTSGVLCTADGRGGRAPAHTVEIAAGRRGGEKRRERPVTAYPRPLSRPKNVFIITRETPPTPIGNLETASYGARRHLKNVSFVRKAISGIRKKLICPVSEAIIGRVGPDVRGVFVESVNSDKSLRSRYND